jgi:hypothetical protein
MGIDKIIVFAVFCAGISIVCSILFIALSFSKGRR